MLVGFSHKSGLRKSLARFRSQRTIVSQMLDSKLRLLKEKILEPFAAAIPLSPNGLTLLGFLFGVWCTWALSQQQVSTEKLLNLR